MVTRRRLLKGLLFGLGAKAAYASAPVEASSLIPHEQRAIHALNRLAYGPRPADVAAIRLEGPAAWLNRFLEEQLDPQRLSEPVPLRARLESLETLTLSQSELLARFRKLLQAGNAASQGSATAAAGADNTRDILAEARRELIRPVVLQAAEARIVRAVESPAQLQEVLVDFWFNHFNVFVGKAPVSVLVGAYEREAIRPFVLGRFRDLLGASAKHPAMLYYLDNAFSVKDGYRPPASMLANPNLASPSGLNENYARELMELHTLGVDGGYSQRDVTELARIFTGWTVNQRAARMGASGTLFFFDPARHDSAPKRWLGRAIEGAGQAGGERALDVLAAHPSTARHLSFKLAQAFVADEPPPALVAKLADRFLQSDGDLKAVMQTLLSADEFWSVDAMGAKFKTPYQYFMSSLRGLGAGAPSEIAPIMQLLAQAGMPLYGAQTPAGHKNTASAWMHPEAIAQRVQFSSNLAQRRARQGHRIDLDAQTLMDSLGPMLSATTRQTVAAEPANTRLALLLASPDFMRC